MSCSGHNCGPSAVDLGADLAQAQGHRYCRTGTRLQRRSFSSLSQNGPPQTPHCPFHVPDPSQPLSLSITPACDCVLLRASRGCPMASIRSALKQVKNEGRIPFLHSFRISHQKHQVLTVHQSSGPEQERRAWTWMGLPGFPSHVFPAV